MEREVGVTVSDGKKWRGPVSKGAECTVRILRGMGGEQSGMRHTFSNGKRWRGAVRHGGVI